MRLLPKQFSLKDNYERKEKKNKRVLALIHLSVEKK